MMGTSTAPASLQVLGRNSPRFGEILSPDALAFVAALERRFGARREELLQRRREVQQQLDEGEFPTLQRPKHSPALDPSWRVAPFPADLADRRVEITGPTERKMMINALNSGASTYMADFEDSHSPTWQATIEGQVNLRDAVRREITYLSPEGKRYALGEKTAVLLVRPRGWHLTEGHVLLDGRPISASLFDFGLAFFHNAHELLRYGSGPYYYLPKLESHVEARLWNDVFVFAQETLGLPRGTIKATVLIETILAAFEMEEILYELREHSVGLNCGRWDYIFSFIKRFRNHSRFVLPDRWQVTMEARFLRAYSHLLIQTCHRRGAHAMGGMAAQIPIKGDPKANEAAMAKVLEDKWREVKAGHDGTWVAHPGLVPVARQVFDQGMTGPNQLSRLFHDLRVGTDDLLAVPEGAITDEGLRKNVRVGLAYLEAWLGGLGCVPIDHLMEDAATVEISRAQIWQWARYGKVSEERFRALLHEYTAASKSPLADEAARLLERIVLAQEFVEFLTLPAYERLLELEAAADREEPRRIPA
ncbi:MAG: malate synthase A [Oligoflexia bacterium]|nr:malate synthase A [Oligoflexia bacterium]